MTGHPTHVVRLGGEGAPAQATCGCGWTVDALTVEAAARACWAHQLDHPAPPAVTGHRAGGGEEDH